MGKYGCTKVYSGERIREYSKQQKKNKTKEKRENNQSIILRYDVE